MWSISLTISIVVLLICQHCNNNVLATRLPLEVYELTPPPTATTTAAQASATENSNRSNNSNHNNNTNFLSHKNLEYEVVNVKTNHTELSTDLHYLSTTSKPHQQQHGDSSITTKTQNQQQLEQRRSRQMLQQQQQQQQHHYNYDALLQQKLKQQQQQKLLLDKEATFATRQRHAHAHNGEVRVLYQIGDSEEDLPICAPHAVCSKIDLYETPWIERQCRCAESNRQPHVITHHHHHNNNNNKEYYSTSLHSAEKFRSYYEQDKLLQNKRLLMDEINENQFENLHLKKLMQKLRAVYKEDLELSPHEYEDNDALPPPLEAVSDNEFPSAAKRSSLYSNGAHMRHSAHSGHHQHGKESMSFIGGCPSGLGIEDGHTIADKTRHYKLCQPVHKLPICKHFRDYTWTLTTSAELNVTEQIVHCRCPKNSVTYLTKREPAADGSNSYKYLFACSPVTRIRCQRKQPCKLFTVRKRQEFLDEVNINALCQCPKGHHCPSHHTQSGVIAGESFLEDNIQTYSGYCMTND